MKKATAAGDGEAKAKGSSGSGGKGSGAGGASDVGWYGNMLHDRFYSEWVQPTSVVHSARLSVLLRIRIQRTAAFPNIRLRNHPAIRWWTTR